ncbi:translocon subunit [Podochytrium sp. JEL0797]|nr:translocon subunit [Podochytrium sp. JEL0797]
MQSNNSHTGSVASSDSGHAMPLPAPLITGSQIVHMYTRIRCKRGDQIITAPSSPRVLKAPEQNRSSADPAKDSRSVSLSSISPNHEIFRENSESSNSHLTLCDSPMSPGYSPSLSGRTPSTASIQSASTTPTKPATQRSVISVQEDLFYIGPKPNSRSNSSSSSIKKRSKSKSRSHTSTSGNIYSIPDSTSFIPPRTSPAQAPLASSNTSIFGISRAPLNTRPPLPPSLSTAPNLVRAGAGSTSTSSPRLNTSQKALPSQRHPSPPSSPKVDHPIAFHLKASIDQFTTTETVVISTDKVNALATRASVFYFLEMQHEIVLNAWNGLQDGYGVVKLPMNHSLGGGGEVASWNEVTRRNLKAHHPTAPTRLNYLPPTVHLAMPGGRDVGVLVQWLLTHEFGTGRMDDASKKLVQVLDEFNGVPRELRFLHLIQVANRLGMTEAARLQAVVGRPESMCLTVKEGMDAPEVYAPLICWAVENWPTSFLSHPDFSHLWHASISGIDESFIIQFALAFQNAHTSSHAAVAVLTAWCSDLGSVHPPTGPLKALANRVADVANSLGDEEAGRELVHAVWESVWAWEERRSVAGLDERERALQALEVLAEEGLNTIEEFEKERKMNEVKGLVEFQRREYVTCKREMRASSLKKLQDQTGTAKGHDSGIGSGSDEEVVELERRLIQEGRDKLGAERKGQWEKLLLDVELFGSDGDDELVSPSCLPPRCPPPPPPASSYFEASSVFTRREDSESSVYSIVPRDPALERPPSVLRFLNESIDRPVSVTKHASQDIEEDEDDDVLQIPRPFLKLPTTQQQQRRSSFSSISSVSSTTSTALFSHHSSATTPMTPNDHTKSGFFDYLFQTESNSAAPHKLSDWGHKERGPDSPLHQTDHGVDQWIAEVAYWEFANWKKEVKKMKGAYLELPSSPVEECMRIAMAEDSGGGVGAGPFGGTFEEEEGGEKKGGIVGILKKLTTGSGSAAKGDNGSKLGDSFDQEFCWDEGLKGGEVDGDVIVASVVIVRDSGGSTNIKSYKSILRLVPQISSPSARVPFGDKIVWTFSSGVVFLFGTQMPLFLAQQTSSDALYWLRPVLGGNRASVMDFGVSSVVAAALVCQLLYASGRLTVDFSLREHKVLFGALQKGLAMVFVLLQAVIAVFGGVYGSELTPFAMGALILQLCVAGMLCITIDEVLQRGYGFGTGYNLFIGAHITENLVWNTLSFRSLQTGRGTEYEGSLVALVQLVLTRRDKFRAVKEAFYRTNLPNVSSLLVQVGVLGAALYGQAVRYEITLQHSLQRQNMAKFPIKLFYCGGIPVLVVATAVGMYTFVSQALFNIAPQNILVRVLGVWKSYDKIPQRFASSGLAYYLSPPRSLFAAFRDPFQFALYAGLVVFACVAISSLWPEAAGTTAKDSAKMLESKGLVFPGRREGGIYKELKKLVPSMSMAGGAVLAVLAVVGDLLGPNGTGTSSVILLTTLYQFFEIIAVEWNNRPPGEELF